MALDFLNSHRCKYPFEIDTEDFLIKTAQSTADINKAQRLRHKIFLEEGLGKSHETGLDFDEYDAIADHLMIIDKKSMEAVGTYRLICSKFSDKFYSQGEFNLDSFLKIEGTKLEMGRACTHSDFRNGRTMDLLWEGLSKYIMLCKTRYLFGCSSVDSTDNDYMFSLLKSLETHEKLKRDFDIHPIKQYVVSNSEELLAHAPPMPAYTKALPPLLRSYLHAGSFVYGMPAYDEPFACYDLLTILDLQALTKKFKERYLPEYPSS